MRPAVVVRIVQARAFQRSPALAIIRPQSCTGKPDTYNKGFAGYDW
jgi:hypothetical protein